MNADGAYMREMNHLVEVLDSLGHCFNPSSAAKMPASLHFYYKGSAHLARIRREK